MAHPPALLVLLGSFLVGITLHGVVQGGVLRIVSGRGSGGGRLRAVGSERPEQFRKADPRVHIDPFGIVAAGISGLGWGKPVPLPSTGARGRRTGAVVAVALSGPIANVALGVGLLLAWRALKGPVGGPAGGQLPLLTHLGGAAYYLQHGLSLSGTPFATGLYLAGCSQVYLGALSLVPLPPLDGGRLLFALAPRQHTWQQAEFQLVERNIGMVILLVALLIPLGGSVSLLPRLLDLVLTPLITAVSGG